MNEIAEVDSAADLTEPAPQTRSLLIPLVMLAVFALIPLAGQFGSSGFVLSLLTRTLILGLAAMSLDLLIGCGGMVSFGHAAYIAIGAYAVGILSSHGINDGFLQIVAALVVSCVFALFTGAISLRTRGVYFIMITLAFGQMLFFLGTSLAAYGGDDGLSLSARSLFFGVALFKSDVTLYYVTLGFVVLFYIVCRAIVASRFGRVLRGIKENAVRMEAIGFAPYRYQLVAYVIAGMIAAIAGVLLANQNEFISPAYGSWQRSGELIFMIVLGGLGSLHGAIIGALMFTVLAEYLSGLTEYWGMIFGPFLILVVLFARGGLVGLLGGAGK